MHFPLTAAQASGNSRLRFTIDLFGGGAWVGYSLPGFNSHDVAVRVNGVLVHTKPSITWNHTIVVTVPASAVNAVAGPNVLQIERTGGTGGGYIQFDWLGMEVDENGLRDADGDGMAKWFEETYGFSDSDPADAAPDPDGDGLTNLQEVQKGTNPTDPDADHDGLPDGLETVTDPLSPDTDGDGLPDGAEKISSPILVDTDGDGYPDNIEVEQGTNPASAASKPFDLNGAVGFQFISESRTDMALKSGEPAGYFRLFNWNTSGPQPKWNGEACTGAATALKNHRGQATAMAVNWSARSSSEGLHQEPSDGKLLSGMIYAGMNGTARYPATVSVTGIPHGT